MPVTTTLRIAVFCLVAGLFGVSPVAAQWATNPLVNLSIADRTPSEQVIPKVAATADGGCYVGWFDHASGNYDVYLQRLDAQGVEQWAHNGVLISSNPQNSFLVDWDLIVDSQDHCVLVFADDRNGGGDFDIYAYRVTPAGNMLWGANGVTISSNNAFEAAPRVCELGNGSFAFCWSREASTIMGQVVTPAGAIQYPANGLALGGMPGESPAFCEMVASNGSSYIVLWVRNIASFISPRHLHAQKFNLAGTPLWGAAPVPVYDATSVPLGYAPSIQSDDAGGAVIVWHSSPTGSLFNCRMQHLNITGTQLHPHNGVTVSTDATRHHIDPAFVYHPATGETLVFFNERNGAQSQWGVYGQKFNAAGVRQWGATGLQLMAVDNTWEGFTRALPSGTGAMVFVLHEPTAVLNNNSVLGMRVDASGIAQWPGQPLVLSSLLSSKGRLPVAATPQGAALVIWEDERTDAADVYGQRIGEDGVLGPGVSVPTFVRNDCNADGSNNIADPIRLLSWLFGTSPVPDCGDACDCNDDEALNIADAICILNTLFAVPAPAVLPPFPNCGPDPSGASLDCAGFAPCP